MNKATLIGRLTKDVETRFTQQTNTAIATFTLAVARKFKKPGDPEADFILVLSFGKTAEFCSKYFTKGQQVAIVGRIQTSTWDDTDGKKRYKTEVIAEEVYFADSKQTGSETQNGSNQQELIPCEDSESDLPF